MSILYTGKGDKGKIIVGKRKIDKACVEIESLGDLDELNSLIGIIKNLRTSKELKVILNQIQEDLFIIQANIASVIFGGKAPKFKRGKIAKTEKIIDDIEKKTKPERKFVIPGTTLISGWLHYARAAARRTERSALKFSKKQKLAPEILAYLNRLASLFFALALEAAKKSKRKEKHPKYE